MIKLIATDLDGTLLEADHVSVSKENADALKEASSRGIKIVIASGRTHKVFSAGVRELTFIDYAIMSNGASMMTYDPATGEPLEHSPVSELPYEIWEPVFRMMAEAGADPEIYAFGQSFMDRERGDRFKSPALPVALVEELKSHITFVDDVTETLRGKSIEKMCFLTLPENNRDTLTSTLMNDNRLEIISSIPGNIEVNLKGTSKGRALRMICDNLGILPEEVMAFGDAGNDIEMLKFAGYSIAMENATDEAKAVSRYRTGSNVNDGVAEAIRKYAL